VVDGRSNVEALSTNKKAGVGMGSVSSKIEGGSRKKI